MNYLKDIAELILDKMMKNQLNSDELFTTFSQIPDLYNFFANEYANIVVDTGHKQEAFLSIPYINLLLFSINNRMNNSNNEELTIKILNDFNLHTQIKPYQEIYFEQKLVHMLDIYSVSKLSEDKSHVIVPTFKTSEQLFNFIHNHSNKIDIIKFLDNPNVIKSIDFNVTEKELFFKNLPSVRDELFVTRIKSFDEKQLVCNALLNFKTCNMQEMSHPEMAIFQHVIEYLIKNNKINMLWDESTLLTIINNNNNNVKNEYVASLVAQNIHCLSQELLTISYLKNKLLFQTLNLMSQAVIEFHQAVSVTDEMKNKYMPELSVAIVETIAENRFNFHPSLLGKVNINTKAPEELWTNAVEQLMTKKLSLLKSDKDVSVALDDLFIKLDFLLQPSSIEVLQDNMENHILVDSMVNTYLPTIINNYIKVPSHMRQNTQYSFLSSTLSQLEKINQKIEILTADILSQDMKKMRVFDKFLNERLSTETHELIQIVKTK